MKNIKNLILDMDGVIWRGTTLMPGFVNFFEILRRLDINFVMATNNASSVATEYVAKFAKYGVEIGIENVVTSGEATADYLKEKYGKKVEETAVYVVGSPTLKQAIADRGFQLVPFNGLEVAEQVDAVVVGFHREATYKTLAIGSLYVHKGATFIGTNPDQSFPSEIGPLPGAGSLQAVIHTATGIAPTVIGKPGPIMFEQAMARLGGTQENTAMVGDRLSTDIAGGKAAGLRTIMVLSGISSRADMDAGDIKPDYIMDDITALAKKLADGARAKGGV